MAGPLDGRRDGLISLNDRMSAGGNGRQSRHNAALVSIALSPQEVAVMSMLYGAIGGNLVI